MRKPFVIQPAIAHLEANLRILDKTHDIACGCLPFMSQSSWIRACHIGLVCFGGNLMQGERAFRLQVLGQLVLGAAERNAERVERQGDFAGNLPIAAWRSGASNCTRPAATPRLNFCFLKTSTGSTASTRPEAVFSTCMFRLTPSTAMSGSLRSGWRRTSEPSSTEIFGLLMVPVMWHLAGPFSCAGPDPGGAAPRTGPAFGPGRRSHAR